MTAATADEPVMLPADLGQATVADLEAMRDWLDGEPDAGRGLVRSNTGALVSVPWGPRCRWMALHCQAAVCGVWNAAVLALSGLRWPYRNRRWLLVRRGSRRTLGLAYGCLVPVVVGVTAVVEPLWVVPVAFGVTLPVWVRLARQVAEPREVVR